MGKTRQKPSNKRFDDEDRLYEYVNHEELRHHRQEKRLNAALKRKNLEELLNLQEKDDWD